MDKKVICATGHRPDKLWGYDLKAPEYALLKGRIQEVLIKEGCTEAISGMALGVDTVFAIAVVRLKQQGYPIILHAAVPCQNQDKMWQPESKKLYHTLLRLADKVTLVNDKPYSPSLMQRRNEFMVNSADKVLAVWDGSPGGTGNCIAFAKKQQNLIIRINPITIPHS